MRIIKKLMMAALLVACSDSESPAVPDTDTEIDTGETIDRVVTFAAGGADAATRLPFAEETPVKIYIWQYTSAGVNLAGTPFKTVWGKMVAKDANYSTVELTDGDLTEEGALTVRSGVRYEFVAIVDATPDATLDDIDNVVSAGKIALTHGRDLLVARQEVKVAYSTEPVVVKFTENGAVDGIIPHLACAMNAEVFATQRMINDVNYDFPLELTVLGMDFIDCMPATAQLELINIGQLPTFGNDVAKVSIDFETDAVTLETINDHAITEYHYMLPYPLRTAHERNVVNLLFRFNVNTIDTDLLLEGVEVPAFESGYRYTFVIEIEYMGIGLLLPDTEADLSLLVSPWDDNTLSWDEGIGADTRAIGRQVVPLGKYKAKINRR